MGLRGRSEWSLLLTKSGFSRLKTLYRRLVNKAKFDNLKVYSVFKKQSQKPCSISSFRGVPEGKFKVRRGWVWEGVPEWVGDTNDWCLRSGGMGTVDPSKVRKSSCKIVVPHSSVANRNSHADPSVSQVYEVGKVTQNI